MVTRNLPTTADQEITGYEEHFVEFSTILGANS